MSAYMVERDHIDFLVSAMLDQRINSGFHWYWHESSRSLEQHELQRILEIGQLLWTENLKSIHARYGKRPENDAAGYVYNRFMAGWETMDPVQVIKAVHCYRYQSCEHEGWKDSEAKCITDRILDNACTMLPGYDDAEWGPPERTPRIMPVTA